ncbi:Esterase E4 [Armadillidium nasatum]|uniref:Esterase E4 n=1 Tax=Armadillidium nasatum TaxID=96803 RepID=A0A5N5T4S9_9CRUS|nr:Esterase E4 [Armadillidium nasatum]
MKLNLLFILCLILFCTSNGRKIKTEQGWLIGKEEKSQKGRNYFAFRNIPYALPPTEELRFKPPKPLKNWAGILNATAEGEFCAQAALGYDEGKEDCLHLSVYTPKISEEEVNFPFW